MPILSNILGNQKSFPLFLLAQPLQIELNLNSLTRALVQDTTAPTDFEISDIRFVYESIYPGQDYENAVRSYVQQNGAYSFNFFRESEFRILCSLQVPPRSLGLLEHG